jgi:hypothetical protein
MKDSSEQGGYVLEGALTLWLGDDETGDPARRRQLSTRQPCPLPLRQPVRPTHPRALGLHLIKTTRNRMMDAVCSELLAEVRGVSSALPRCALRRPDFPGHPGPFLRQALPNRNARKSRRRQRALKLPQNCVLLGTQGGLFKIGDYCFNDGDPDAVRRLVPGTLKRVSWEKQPLGQMLITSDGTEKPIEFEPREVLAQVLTAARPAKAFIRWWPSSWSFICSTASCAMACRNLPAIR